MEPVDEKETFLRTSISSVETVRMKMAPGV